MDKELKKAFGIIIKRVSDLKSEIGRHGAGESTCGHSWTYSNDRGYVWCERCHALPDRGKSIEVRVL